MTVLTRLAVLLPFAFVLTAASAATVEKKRPDPVVAVGVLLAPDAATVERAVAVNANLRKDYPQGFALDAQHPPHITLVQRFVHASDLPAVEAAVEAVASSNDVTALPLEATRRAWVPWGAGVLALDTLTVDVSPQLRAFEQKIVDAVQPFAVSEGTAAAFVPNGDRSGINPETVREVARFVPQASGDNYVAQLSLGIGHADVLQKLDAKPFEPFSFRAAGVAIYQLGDHAMPRKKLWPSGR